MKLEELGYTDEFERYRSDHQLSDFEAGRVAIEHKERYVVRTEKGEWEAELLGNLRFTAESRSDFPAVGDWVAISEYDEGKALIHAIYSRKSVIERQAVGKSGQKQIIAANIDVGIIVQAVDRDFNINRLERYLTICHTSQITPLIVLNKIDLVSETDLAELLEKISHRIPDTPTVCISNETRQGMDHLRSHIKKGVTYCLLGSSGVGKSTLLNSLAETELMETATISTSVNKGRHTTSHRELIILKNGGIIIDNPGLREVGIADASSGLEITFDTIQELAQNCRYKDCQHINEKGCAVIAAVYAGDLDADAYGNFLKLEREKAHFESTVEEKRKKDKDLGKMIRNVQKIRKKNKY